MKIGPWERATGGLLTAAALVFLAAYAIPIIWAPVASGRADWLLNR